MDYSTFRLNDFFIKKDSTLPELKYPLIQHVREKYDLTDNMLENVAITFSMTDADTGLYRIANVPASLVINNDRPEYPDEVRYTLVYKFTLKDTRKAGRYLGEFKLDFLGENECGKITLPTEGYINIIISDSMTKTTVV
ncbi:MAG: hypothetical protein WC333_00790 [Dehalococcoidia bacterium]|jgi:hypothetical protein